MSINKTQPAKGSKMRQDPTKDIRKLTSPVVEILTSEVVWSDNRYVSVISAQVRVNEFVKQWTFIKAFDSVCIALKDTSTNNFLMLVQFRLAAESNVLEFVVGKVDIGETPKAAATRETKEKTGYDVKNIQHLGSAFSDAAFCENRTHYFYGELDTLGDTNLSTGEHIIYERNNLESLNNLVHKKQITNGLALTMIGLLNIYKQ